MQWLVKARVRPGSTFNLDDELAGGPSAGQPFAKELRRALAARPREDAAFYFPVDAKDPERALGPVLHEHLEILGKTKIDVVQSGYGFEDEDDRPAKRAAARPAPRRRRASEEDD